MENYFFEPSVYSIHFWSLDETQRYLSGVPFEDVFIVQLDGGKPWNTQEFLLQVELDFGVWGDASWIDIDTLTPGFPGFRDFLSRLDDPGTPRPSVAPGKVRAYFLLVSNAQTFWALNYGIAAGLTSSWQDALQVWLKVGVGFHLIFIDDHEPPLPRLTRP